MKETNLIEERKYPYEKFLDEVLPDWDKKLTMRVSGSGRKTTEGYFQLKEYLRDEIDKIKKDIYIKTLQEVLEKMPKGKSIEDKGISPYERLAYNKCLNDFKQIITNMMK